MGRYYNGDIQGKFWFGVQSSDDAEFFGAQGSEPNYINYYLDDIEQVELGVKKCLMALQQNKDRLKAFFDILEFGYNDEMIASYWKKEFGIALSEKEVREMLVWFARLELGEKILNCMKEHGECSFTAEL
jgi:hypothetical protein